MNSDMQYISYTSGKTCEFTPIRQPNTCTAIELACSIQYLNVHYMHMYTANSCAVIATIHITQEHSHTLRGQDYLVSHMQGDMQWEKNWWTNNTHWHLGYCTPMQTRTEKLFIYKYPIFACVYVNTQCISTPANRTLTKPWDKLIIVGFSTERRQSGC